MSSFTETFNNREPPCVTRDAAWSRTHRDLQATAMSIDYSGQWVLLAGRRHLALQKLDPDQTNDDNFLRKYHRNSKHEITAAEWAICDESQEYCAIATSQLIEVVTWRSGDPNLIHSLRAHTRVITDIDWHSKTPYLLASCSIDTFTHLWDLRDPKKPTMSLSAVCMSGATQVGFNRVSGNLLATAHDGDLRIWDVRKGACPIQYITAHLARIHGINWSHKQETHLTTASQDGTVKYFCINNPRRAEKIITTSSPVWRARYTPFSDGLVTVIVPNLGRGENSLLLWNNARQSAPICSFTGHSDVILDFSWRPNRHYDNTDMELVTWSRDQTLRVWNVDETIQKMCEPETPDEEESVSTDILFDGIPIKPKSVLSKPNSLPTNQHQSIPTLQTEITKPMPKFSLQHEFSLLNTNIPHIDVEVLDAVKRHAMIRISVNGHVIMLQVVFPENYPHVDYPPDFIYCQGTSIDDNLAESLNEVLKLNAQNRLRKGKTCLEQCLRALVTTLKKITSTGDKSYLRLQSPRLEGALSGALHDACVPFPKTCGARFCQVGILVTFI
ncbi:GATOR complex protein Wdr59, partial [Contarinia nasturtii]|uniref:GATOR complex protein Wdr59 n=1 Tax=Contarinia nasturtii TaxID=265458 RepID=UPI0012D4C2BE